MSYKVFQAHGPILVCFSIALSQTPAHTARLEYFAVCSFTSHVEFAGIQCAYPRRDGQAELKGVWLRGLAAGRRLVS